MTERASCRNCRFWRDEGVRPVPPYSECRRFPPQQFIRVLKPNTAESLIDFRNVQSGPETVPSFWCGEHQFVALGEQGGKK